MPPRPTRKYPSQETLSRRLSILEFKDYFDPAAVRSNISERTHEPDGGSHRAVRALDVVALCLTSGEQGDVTAAAFYPIDSKKQNTLIVCKNREATPQDRLRLIDFKKTLIASSAWTDVFRDFILRHCAENITKRVKLFKESFSQIHKQLEDMANTYTPPQAPLDQVFPRSDKLRETLYKGGEPADPRVMLFDVLRKCRQAAGEFAIDRPEERETAQQNLDKYLDLWKLADCIRVSAFMELLLLPLSTSDDIVAKFIRRLNKVCQYARIELLLKHYDWTTLPTCWATLSSTVMPQGGKFSRGTANSMLEPLMSKQKSNLAAINMMKNTSKVWNPRDILRPTIHAEIKMIIFIHTRTSPKAVSDSPSPQLPIGCSKRSCICCSIWIAAFNESSEMAWMTSGSHGKPYDQWAFANTVKLPDSLYEHVAAAQDIVADRIRGILVKFVGSALLTEQELQLFPESDEDASAGESDTSSNKLDLY
ncbi:hypothetical protein DXG03_008880 [Asterophora parasitica]|uniref:Uncharacterized protein n=1 Tax=Asterophora parasitica TaxID=117018 RepID=A0A9P7G4K1_9AGAR|nr:hypothetical protein DXG03_008880 [Asterophora parasitica]